MTRARLIEIMQKYTWEEMDGIPRIEFESLAEEIAADLDAEEEAKLLDQWVTENRS